MKQIGIRLLSVLLALAMLAGILPGKALAAEPDYRYGTLKYYSVISGGYVDDSYYYTDQWFLEDAAERNDSLALVSAQLAAAVTSDPQCGLDLLAQLGFEAKAARFDSDARDDCAYVLGTKTVQTDGTPYTLVAVAFQGADYGEKGWQQNVAVNSGDVTAGNHAAFSAAARTFTDDYGRLGLKGDTVLWITGQSRGGAVANLVSAYFLRQDTCPAVFGYTFESPAVTDDGNAKKPEYDSIHNYLCDDDPVPMVPMWGMTRYGQEILYNTADIEAVKAELEKRNPDAVEYAGEYDAEPFPHGVKEYLEGLVAKLTAVVPERADYSGQKTDGFSSDDKSVQISYTYQEGLRGLCHLIYGGEGGINAMLFPLLGELPGVVYAYLEEVYAAEKGPGNQDALCQDAVRRRWEAAAVLKEAAGSDSAVDQSALYALLKLLSPVLIDADKVKGETAVLPEFNDVFQENASDYIGNDVYLLLEGASTVLLSHQPDVILARLRLLAPAPAMDDVSLTIPDPKAGDLAKSAPVVVREAVDDLGKDWLTVQEADWLTDDAALADGKAYCLSVTLAAAGHTIPDGVRYTINGQKPTKQEVEYRDGKTLITGVWTFTLGKVDKVAVTFDAGGHGSAPAAASADRGVLLKYAGLAAEDLGLVEDSEGIWRFDGWYGGEGTPWEEIYADQDVTLHAKWTRLINDVTLTYSIPRVGDSGESLTAVTVPEGAPYRIAEDRYLCDKQWNPVAVVSDTGELMLEVHICPSSDGAEFLVEQDEWGNWEYAGRLTFNGSDDVEVNYDEDGGYLRLEYRFAPQADSPSSSHSSRQEEQPEAPDRPGGSGFVDVAAGAYYADAVEWAVQEGITDGVDGTHFAPDVSCTRAQMVTFLWRAAGQPEPSGTDHPFVDVAEDAYYAKAVLWAAEQGITDGVDASRFAPDAAVDRAQSVTFLYRLLGEKTDGANPFSDVSEDAYYADAVHWACATGVTDGRTDDTFAPEDDCTRAQIVTFLYRAMGQE